jgi:hypothetical protein
MAVLLIVTPCSVVEVCRRFRGACCLHRQVDTITEAANASETSVSFYETSRRYNPEDSHLHTHRRENLKSCRMHYSPIYL